MALIFASRPVCRIGKHTPSQYCSSGVCLQDSLASLLSLDWEEMTAGQDALSPADANPFIGLTDAEYQRLRELGDDDVEERVQLLGKIRVSCQIGEFSLGLDIPGRDIVEVTFGTPLAENGGSQQFQVIRIDRLYRSFAWEQYGLVDPLAQLPISGNRSDGRRSHCIREL